MTGEQYRTVVDFETTLVIGQPVRVVWTNCGTGYDGIGTVAKINGKSIRVMLSENVPTGQPEYPYAAGREIIVPRIKDYKGWSCRNRVEPVGGY